MWLSFSWAAQIAFYQLLKIRRTCTVWAKMIFKYIVYPSFSFGQDICLLSMQYTLAFYFVRKRLLNTVLYPSIFIWAEHAFIRSIPGRRLATGTRAYWQLPVPRNNFSIVRCNNKTIILPPPKILALLNRFNLGRICTVPMDFFGAPQFPVSVLFRLFSIMKANQMFLEYLSYKCNMFHVHICC